MILFCSTALFLVLSVLFAWIGVSGWSRPRAAIDRIAGARVSQDFSLRHPSLGFGDVLARLGNAVPLAPQDTSAMQRRLIRAGFRSPGALKTFYGTKIALAIAAPLLAAVLASPSDAGQNHQTAFILVSVAAGFLAPNQFVRLKRRRRERELRRGLPNALDLLVVCVESGLGLDQAIMQVSKELMSAHPEISEEFALINLELKAGKRRVEALRNLADRTGAEDIKRLAAVMIQADRFGTSIGQSLRGHSDYMRVQKRQQVEEKAAKLGVKLVFPIFFCILPSLFVVTVGPMVVRIVRDLLPMMNNM
jgi:tight adherence protein C